MMKATLLVSLAAALAGTFLVKAADTVPALAFPGAEGFGRFTTGGRGGEIVHVANLNDSGAESFRDAVSKSHRIVVFDVSGIIRLKSNVSVSSDVTILGQTAPGDGICFYGRSVSFSGERNVIVRYVRFRQGIEGDRGKCSVNLSSGSNMIFDHCSIEWGRWDCLGLTRGSHDVTFQDCIIGEGVAPQSFGSLSDSVTNITYARNLWTNNRSRNPKAKGRIQYINNVVYNWTVCGLVGGHSEADHYLDALGNYFIAGPNSNGRAAGEFAKTDHVFQKDNWADTDKDGKLNARELGTSDFGSGEGAPTFVTNLTVAPQIAVKILSASAALTNVLANAGCSLHRDAVDARLIDEVKSFGKHGKRIDSETEIGGIGELKEIHRRFEIKNGEDVEKALPQSVVN